MSTSNDWRTPFKELCVGLRSLYDANLNLFHGVLLSTRRTREELKPTFGMLEPAHFGETLLRSIEADTAGASFHGHLFFANDRRVLDQLGRLLDGIENWMDTVPSGVLPGFEIPKVGSQVDRNLIRWVSIVYYLAWSSDKPYLDLEIEFEQEIGVLPFLPWGECPQPPCRPLEWLTHRSSASAALLKIKTQFEQRGERFPDVVHAYLTGEFIASSMAAIDILIYVLHGERKSKSRKQPDYVKKLKRTKQGKSKTDKEVERLSAILIWYHSPDLNRDCNATPKEPLTQLQIAEKMEWTAKKQSTLTSRASRRMEKIFGTDPMEAYKRELYLGTKSKLPPGASYLRHAIVDPLKVRPLEDAEED